MVFSNLKEKYSWKWENSLFSDSRERKEKQAHKNTQQSEGSRAISCLPEELYESWRKMELRKMEQCWDTHSPWQPHNSSTLSCQMRDFKRLLRKHTVGEVMSRFAGEEGETSPCYHLMINEASWVSESERIICSPASGSKKWKAAGVGDMHKDLSLLCLYIAFCHHSLKFARSESMVI